MASTDERDGGLEITRAQPAPIADGDDIQVVPAGSGDPPGSAPRRRLLVGAAIAAAVVLVAGIALAARHTASSSAGVRTTTPTTPASVPVVAKVQPKPTVPVKKTVPAVVVPTVPTTAPRPSVSVAPASVPNPTNPRPAPTTPATTAAPLKQYGPSVLTWNAPSSLMIAAGQRATLSVLAHNPTTGVVTLPHPLSCTPRLDHGELCPEIVQLIGAGQTASARYIIDATGSAPGRYVLKIEGVLTVAVTVS